MWARGYSSEYKHTFPFHESLIDELCGYKGPSDIIDMSFEELPSHAVILSQIPTSDPFASLQFLSFEIIFLSVFSE